MFMFLLKDVNGYRRTNCGRQEHRVLEAEKLFEFLMAIKNQGFLRRLGTNTESLAILSFLKEQKKKRFK